MPPPQPQPQDQPDMGAPPGPSRHRNPQGSGSSVSSIYLFCRGVDLTTDSTTGNRAADRDIANEFINELRDSKYFDSQTQAPDRIEPDPNGTFTFGMTLKLKRPLKL